MTSQQEHDGLNGLLRLPAVEATEFANWGSALLHGGETHGQAKPAAEEPRLSEPEVRYLRAVRDYPGGMF